MSAVRLLDVAFYTRKKSNKRTVAVCLNIDFDQSGILTY